MIPPHFTRSLVRGEKPGAAGRGGCDRPVRRRATRWPRSTRRRHRRCSATSPGRCSACRPRRRPTRSSCTAATTRRACRATTSCPGLVGTILTMTMVMLTSLAMTRERERGTMENLLATPVLPAEVMAGKILPYVVIGYVQLGVILAAALAAVRGAAGRQLPAADGDDRRLHRGQPGRGLHLLDARAQPAAGDADDVLLLPAQHAAVGLHVPVPRDAAVGAVARRGAAAHALPAHRARHHAQGQHARTCCCPSCGRCSPSWPSPASWRSSATARRWIDRRLPDPEPSRATWAASRHRLHGLRRAPAMCGGLARLIHAGARSHL